MTLIKTVTGVRNANLSLKVCRLKQNKLRIRPKLALKVYNTILQLEKQAIRTCVMNYSTIKLQKVLNTLECTDSQVV